MKVIEDKVTVYPPHAICKADIPVILSALREEWKAGIQTVRLSRLHRPRRIRLPRLVRDRFLDLAILMGA